MAVGDDWIYPKYHRGGEGGPIHGMAFRSDAPAFFEKVVVEHVHFCLNITSSRFLTKMYVVIRRWYKIWDGQRSNILRMSDLRMNERN